MKPVPMRRRRQSGMTLIEILVSILVFSFGILGMVGMQARAVQFSLDAEDRTRAAVLANEIVSTMWAQKTVSLPASAVTAWVARLQDSTYGLGPSATGSVSSPVGGVATVTITWKAPSKAASDPVNRYVTEITVP